MVKFLQVGRNSWQAVDEIGAFALIYKQSDDTYKVIANAAFVERNMEFGSLTAAKEFCEHKSFY